MPKDIGRANTPEYRYKPSAPMFNAIPGISTTYAEEQATKIMDCSRYLNHTGVMLGDHRRVAASYQLNMMVRALVDEIQK